MSTEMLNEIWFNSTAKGSDRLVLIVLADYADQDGECWPSQQRIAHKANMETRNVQMTLRRLEEAGHIAVLHGQGKGSSGRKTNRYRVLTPWRNNAEATPDHRIVPPPITGSSHPRSPDRPTPDHRIVPPPITGSSHPRSPDRPDSDMDSQIDSLLDSQQEEKKENETDSRDDQRTNNDDDEQFAADVEYWRQQLAKKQRPA